jgi:sRNA-binding carbon storage regulator CsrA
VWRKPAGGSLLVLSRHVGESVVINELVITVDLIADDHSILSLMRTNCEFLGMVTAPFDEYVAITGNVRVVMIQSESGKVRLGFDLPREYNISRWEAWNPPKA